MLGTGYNTFHYEEITPILKERAVRKKSFWHHPIMMFVAGLASALVMIYFFSSSTQYNGHGLQMNVVSGGSNSEPSLNDDGGNNQAFGSDFRGGIENWLSEIIGGGKWDIVPSLEMPTPRFEGSGHGLGTFNCDKYSENWNQLGCLGATSYLSDIINLNDKQLHKYILAIVDLPLHGDRAIRQRAPRLGGSHLLANALETAAGLVPTELVESFGGGSGAGFQISCEGVLLLTAGGGGGGGFEFNANDKSHDYQSGGGGGVQIFDPKDNYKRYNIGGGSGVPSYTPKLDDDTDLIGWHDAWKNVKRQIQGCPVERLHLHGGGGGGGGITIIGEETYLWKYFYFYFELGDSTRYRTDHYMPDDGYWAKIDSGEAAFKPATDYCKHVPDAVREKCLLGWKEAAPACDTAAAPAPAPAAPAQPKAAAVAPSAPKAASVAIKVSIPVAPKAAAPTAVAAKPAAPVAAAPKAAAVSTKATPKA